MDGFVTPRNRLSGSDADFLINIPMRKLTGEVSKAPSHNEKCREQRANHAKQIPNCRWMNNG